VQHLRQSDFYHYLGYARAGRTDQTVLPGAKRRAALRMKITFYASLVGPLLGVYYPLPFTNEFECRAALNCSKLRHLWCRILSREEVAQDLAEYGGVVLPDEFAMKLDYDSHAVLSAQRHEQVERRD
jgi:hypothetical protein